MANGVVTPTPPVFVPPEHTPTLFYGNLRAYEKKANGDFGNGTGIPSNKFNQSHDDGDSGVGLFMAAAHRQGVQYDRGTVDADGTIHYHMLAGAQPGQPTQDEGVIHLGASMNPDWAGGLQNHAGNIYLLIDTNPGNAVNYQIFHGTITGGASNPHFVWDRPTGADIIDNADRVDTRGGPESGKVIIYSENSEQIRFFNGGSHPAAGNHYDVLMVQMENHKEPVYDTSTGNIINLSDVVQQVHLQLDYFNS